MDQIVSDLESWSFFQELPSSVAGFQLKRCLTITNDDKLCLFQYQHLSQQRTIYTVYEPTNKLYMLYTRIGLFDFCDIRFITGDLAKFEQLLTEHLTITLEAASVACGVDSVLTAKKLNEQPWSELLPSTIAGFELFISPEQPVKIINGSYIIIDYSDFENMSNLTVYYNLYRDEFFSEWRVFRRPEIVNVFETKNLQELIAKLNEHLPIVLEQLRNLVTAERC